MCLGCENPALRRSECSVGRWMANYLIAGSNASLYLQATFEMNMRAPALVPAFLGLSLLAIPAESRQYVGTCEDDFDCELGLKCIRTTNKNQVSRSFVLLTLQATKIEMVFPMAARL